MAAADGGMPKLEIGSECLLLVEGRDEVNLFSALLKHCLGDERRGGVQIIAAGGRTKFRNNIQAIRNATALQLPPRPVGVIRDADNSADSAFQSVCDALRHAEYEPPAAYGEIAAGNPPVGVFILPGGAAGGAIETLCRRSVAANDTGRCVEAYIECLKDHGALRSRNEDKTFAHAYLAAGEDPVARVGEGAQQGAWDFDSGAFADLSDFLRRLFAPAA